MTVQEFYKEWRKQKSVASDPRGDWPLRLAVAYHERMMGESPAPAIKGICDNKSEKDHQFDGKEPHAKRWNCDNWRAERVAAPPEPATPEEAAKMVYWRTCSRCGDVDRDSLAKAIAAYSAPLQAKVSRLEQGIEMLRRERKGEVWCWQDDGEDYPESLGCPTLVQPSVIRRWVAAEAKLAALSGESRQ